MNRDELNELLSLLQKGDKTALEQLYREYSIPFYTLTLRLTGNIALSEDILQDLFVKLYLSPPEPPLQNPRAYLYRCLRNLITDTLKKQQNALPLEESIPSTDDPIHRSAERIDLEQAIQTLSSKEQEILSLHSNGGLKFREIAEIMDQPLGTVLWNYQRSIRKLRDILNGGNQ
jgi:RNA polymerase sigma-70 factor (ECF subfamily)